MKRLIKSLFTVLFLSVASAPAHSADDLCAEIKNMLAMGQGGFQLLPAYVFGSFPSVGEKIEYPEETVVRFMMEVDDINATYTAMKQGIEDCLHQPGKRYNSDKLHFWKPINSADKMMIVIRAKDNFMIVSFHSDK